MSILKDREIEERVSTEFEKRNEQFEKVRKLCDAYLEAYKNGEISLECLLGNLAKTVSTSIEPLNTTQNYVLGEVMFKVEKIRFQRNGEVKVGKSSAIRKLAVDLVKHANRVDGLPTNDATIDSRARNSNKKVSAFEKIAALFRNLGQEITSGQLKSWYKDKRRRYIKRAPIKKKRPTHKPNNL